MYVGAGKLMTVLLILVIMVILFVIPCDPMPLSLKPCNVKRSFNTKKSDDYEESVLTLTNQITWKGKWSGPRAGAELI